MCFNLDNSGKNCKVENAAFLGMYFLLNGRKSDVASPHWEKKEIKA